MIQKQFLLCALVVGLLQVAPLAVRAGTILVGAPVPGSGAWDTQSNVPPSGLVFLFADEFSLSSDQFVTDISVSLFGVFPSVAFNLSLLADPPASNPVPLFSVDLDLPNATALFSLPINAVLPADTYYLRLTTNSFVGWIVADPNSFVTTTGSVADGIWEFSPAQGVWTFLGPAFFDSHPGVFSVNGPDVPEPGALTLMGIGIAVATAMTRLKRFTGSGTKG